MQKKNNQQKDITSYQKVLIIKKTNNAFEQYYCDRIHDEGADILPIEQLLPQNEKTFLSLAKTAIKIKKFKRNGLLSYDKIIVFDYLKIAVLLSILLNKKRTRIIDWRWNTEFDLVNHSEVFSLLFRIIKKHVEVWSFDPSDAAKYKIHYNTQFYFHTNILCNQNKKEQDLFFVGKDKGRYALLSNLKKTCDKEGITYLFQMLPETTTQYEEVDADILSECFMDYPETLDHIIESKAVLDLTKPGQDGLTVRVLEAIMYDKKIVTNNLTIKDNEFYSSKSVFILGDRAVDGLSAFLNEPDIQYSPETKKYYDFNSWLDRFDE